MFARQFKPHISKASADYMVEEYKRLRQRDSTGGWRHLYELHALSDVSLAILHPQ